jgi:hypothetical protein
MWIDQDRRNTCAPSMAAAVEPARPLPMIAMSVYFMGNPAVFALFCARKSE